MIGGSIMKWGLGIGAAAAALFGFHKATQYYFTMVAQGFRDLEKTGAALEARGEKLRSIRSENESYREEEAKKISARNEVRGAVDELAKSRAEMAAKIREAKEDDPVKRQKMVVERLAQQEQLAAMKSAASSAYENISPEKTREAIADQVALQDATLDRINAQKELKNLESKTDAPKGKLRKANAINSDSLVAVGNFLGSSKGMIESLAQRQVDLMQTYLPQIARNTARLTSSSGGDYPIA